LLENRRREEKNILFLCTDHFEYTIVVITGRIIRLSLIDLYSQDYIPMGGIALSKFLSLCLPSVVHSSFFPKNLFYVLCASAATFRPQILKC